MYIVNCLFTFKIVFNNEHQQFITSRKGTEEHTQTHKPFSGSLEVTVR